MSDSKPNVLLISTDHWPAHLLNIAGFNGISTPTLDELSRCGTRFTNTFSECPVCIPARRTLQTGLTPRSHGDRMYREKLEMPDVPTMAQCFRDGGYQAQAVGKLHIFPQRNRIGFDDVILDEEGRSMYGVTDDYEIFLGDNGHPGAQFAHGMSNNDYVHRPWHLDEKLHPTNWATEQMSRVIKRRDPTRPGFWFCSYRHPHPPLVPLRDYLDMYRNREIAPPVHGSWSKDLDALPYALQAGVSRGRKYTEAEVLDIQRAFFALCTHIDHQIRALLGVLREEGILDNTIICFTSDHGDMLGNHDMWAKRTLFNPSVKVPMILVGPRGSDRVQGGAQDDRLVGWADIMPTLLDLCGLDIPDTVEGLSMVGDRKRAYFYSEVADDDHASRMVTDGEFKLIYYPVGNYTMLFDLKNDPDEMENLAGQERHQEVQSGLEARLMGELYGGDESWVAEGKLVGVSAKPFVRAGDRTLSAQRGSHWPPAPTVDIPQIEWNPTANN
nr:sulfatase-like hydrolase/transferase [Oceaniglobus trochenteri]